VCIDGGHISHVGFDVGDSEVTTGYIGRCYRGLGPGWLGLTLRNLWWLGLKMWTVTCSAGGMLVS
jgi:hypothetical protein